MLRLTTLLSSMALAGAARVMSSSKQLDMEAAAFKRGECVDINTATYLELKQTGLMSRGLALRIVAKRSCPFKDAGDLQAALTKSGDTTLWNAVDSLLQAGKLCVACNGAGGAVDINKAPIQDLVAAGLDASVAGAINKAMACKFTSFEDFKSRVEGPTYSGLDGGNMEFKVDPSWFNKDALCELVPPCDELCLPIKKVCKEYPPRGWSGNTAELTSFCRNQCVPADNRCVAGTGIPEEAVVESVEEEEQLPSGKEVVEEPKPTGPCAELCLPLGGSCQSFPPLGYSGPMSPSQLDTFCAKQCQPQGSGCAGSSSPLVPVQEPESSVAEEQRQDDAAASCPKSGNVIWNYKNTARCRDAKSMELVKTDCCKALIEAEAAQQAAEAAKAAAAKADAERLAAEAASKASKEAEEKAAAAKAQAEAAEQAAKDAKTAEAVCQAIFDKAGKKACNFPMKPKDVAKELKGTDLSMPASFTCQAGYKCLQSMSKVVRLVAGGSPAACGSYEGKGLTGAKTCIPMKLF